MRRPWFRLQPIDESFFADAPKRYVDVMDIPQPADRVWAELTTDDHPASLLASQRADDDGRRRESLEHLRRLARDHRDEIDMFGYHDPAEFPQSEGDRPGAVASPTRRG